MSAKEERRAKLVEKVELAAAEDLKHSKKDQHQQRRKCSVCGKSYLGQENSSTCGDACRQKKSRSK